MHPSTYTELPPLIIYEPRAALLRFGNILVGDSVWDRWDDVGNAAIKQLLEVCVCMGVQV